MTHPSLDPEFLESTLDSEHDLHGVRSPWTPSSVVFACFFAGPFGAAWLIPQSFRRMGMRREGAKWVLPFLLLGLVACGATIWLVTRSSFADQPDGMRYARMVIRAATVLLALFATHRQRSRFRIHQMEGGAVKSVFGAGLLACLVGSSVMFLLLIAGIAALD